MDTQQNDGKANADDSVGTGSSLSLSSLPKISNSDLAKVPAPSLPMKSPVDKEKDLPENIPFVDDVKEESIIKAELPKVRINPPTKITPGTRGPLPSAPPIMKASTAKFGMGTPLRNIQPKKPIEKSIQEPVDELEKISPLEDGEKINSIVPRPKIGVPQPPKAPQVTEDADFVGKDYPASKIPMPEAPKSPTIPEPINVDRNIRPRRLAIVVITLFILLALIIFSVWFFVFKGSSTTTVPTAEPTLFDTSPTPSATPTSVQQDSDSDGLTDAEEQQLGTDALKADTDGDNYNDKQEIDAGYDPLTVAGKLDSDRDGLSDPGEKCWGTDLTNPDTDGDGYLDGQEVVNNFDPLVPSPNDKLTVAAKCSL